MKNPISRIIRQCRFLSLSAVLYLLCFFFFSPSVFSQKRQIVGKKISKIEFFGLINLGPNELYEVISSRFEKSLTKAALNEDVSRLFATGYFSNVVMRVQLLPDDTVVLNFQVTELPIIDEVIYVGLKELNSQEFVQKLDISEGSFFSLQKIKDGVKTITEAYKDAGFFHAETWYRLSKKDEKKNKLKVYFIIDEGKLIPIGKINILGAVRLDPEAILDVIEQKEGGFFDDSIFQKEKFEQDKIKILAYAKSQGLLDAQLNTKKTGYEIRWRDPTKPEEGRVVVITYTLFEGIIKYFGGYSLEHIPERINQENNPPERKDKSQIKPVYPDDTLLELLTFSNDNIGDFFDENKYFRDRGSLQEAYAQEGYVFAQIQPETIDFILEEKTLARYEKCLTVKKPVKAKQIQCKQAAERLNLEAVRKWLKENPTERGRPMRHIHFQVSENNLAHVEEIIIRGNDKTKDYVIRREILIKKGQLFNSTLVNLSRQNLINLQYFKEVNLQMRPGTVPGKMNIIFEVKEQPTGNIAVGGTYGVSTGFALNTNLSENNFQGEGQTLSGSINYGILQRGISIGWTEPWFYEKCQSSSGPFWKNQQIKFNNANSLEEILIISQNLENDHEKTRIAIQGYVQKTDSGKNRGMKTLDRVKLKIRSLLSSRVLEEETCFRDYHSPWSLGIRASYNSSTITNVVPIQNSSSERAHYQSDSFGLSLSTSHRLSHRWVHYHSYTPRISQISSPSALAPDYYFLREQQNLRFASSLLNGLRFSTIDNNFNPTEGFSQRFELEILGGLLAGDNHFNRYITSTSYYFWWFDFTFGGLIKSRNLKRWRVVQEMTFRGSFTQETGPIYKEQDKEINPYIELGQKIRLGGIQFGFERLRGYTTNDSAYPTDWRLGAHHSLIWGTELRIPLEPSFLWMSLFFDAGSLYNTLSDFTGEQKRRLENYSIQSAAECSGTNVDRHYRSCVEWNDPRRTALSTANIALDRFLYSWGIGLRIQIPVFPLRIFYVKKLYYAGDFVFKPIPEDDSFQLVFGIGDIRF